MPPIVANDPAVLTMIHVYDTTAETQQAVFDGLRAGLEQYGARMAGHLTSSLHKSLDGVRVTSYSQWDRERSRALFDDPAALHESLAWFAPLVREAAGQDAHLYGEIFVYAPPDADPATA